MFAIKIFCIGTRFCLFFENLTLDLFLCLMFLEVVDFCLCVCDKLHAVPIKMNKNLIKNSTKRHAVPLKIHKTT